jgi:nucleoside-diphosphate-sugar epimerase
MGSEESEHDSRRQSEARIVDFPEGPVFGTVAITGITGFVGRHLAAEFLDAGWRVIGLSRRAKMVPDAPRVSYRYFDLRTPFEGDVQDVDVLVHCALEPYRGTGGDAGSINVAAATELFDRARGQGVKRLVFLSSIAARSDSSSLYGLDKYAIEQLLDRDRDLIVRPGLIVGNGGLFRTMYETIRKVRAAPLFSGGRQPVYVVGIADLVRAVVRLVENGSTGEFTLVAPEPVAMRDLYGAIARKADVALRLVPLPYSLTLWAARALERLGATLPLTSGSIAGVGEMRRISVPSSLPFGITIRPFAQALSDACMKPTDQTLSTSTA